MRYYFVILFFFLSIYRVFSEPLDNEIPGDEGKKYNDVEVEELQHVVAPHNNNKNNNNINNDSSNGKDDVGPDMVNEVADAEWKEARDNQLRDFGKLSVEEAFELAVRAYLDDDFDNCIAGFHYILDSYKKYKNTVIKCRTICRDESSSFDNTPIALDDIDNLHFYVKKIRETLCLLKCNQDYRDIAGSQALKRLPKEVEWKIINRKPYEYLHICYYQRSRYQDAANAAFTYLISHPKHEISVNNLRYYLSLPDVKDTEIVNLEAAPFVKYYVKGVRAYEDEYYHEAIDNIEKSLDLYMKNENECRMYCEGPFDQGWHPEFTSSIANHFTYCLKCKRGCSQYLNTINGEYQSDLLASHYNYLQFAYYKMGDIRKTCEAVESYLLFFPADETMINNKEYYTNLPKVLADYFTPRQEALNYVKRHEYELQILSFINREFSEIQLRFDKSNSNIVKIHENHERNFTLEDFEKNSTPDDYSQFYKKIIDEHSMQVVDDDKNDKYVTSKRDSQIFEALKNIHIILRENQLNGSYRYLAEGVVNEDECQSLVKLAMAAAVEGDGYEHNASPQSKYELFKGLALDRLSLLVYFGVLHPQYLELFLNSSETARAHVENYFNLQQPLYFSYTHLVCRSALTDSPKDHDIFSHDIHADNCLAINENTCLRQSPAYTWRDYSAIVYLNDDFDGGEFIFSADPKARKIQSSIKPKCGRMVAFSADEKNLHGVKGVLSGTRCALALWFTLDNNYAEINRKIAYAILDRVKIKGSVHVTNVSIPYEYEQLRQLLRNQIKNDYTLKILMKIL